MSLYLLGLLVIYERFWCPEEASSLGHEVLYRLVYIRSLVQFGTKLFPNLVRIPCADPAF